MNEQLKKTSGFVDEKSSYKSDATSNNERFKSSSDHYNWIADEFAFASAEKFSLVKVFFLHAAENEIHLWSIRFQTDGVFDLWRELCLEIKPEFEDRTLFLQKLLKFCWSAKCLLNQAVQNIVAVQNEHKDNSSKYHHNPEDFNSLSNIVNPVIMKLTKLEDGTGMSSLGPNYSPLHY
ncbi:unnamed protein product [Mucor hiemalis]